MGLEISEAMYAGLSKIGTTRLKEAAKNTEAFNELFPDAVDTFKNTATDAGGLIQSFIAEINDLNKERADDTNRKKLYSDLAAGISAALTINLMSVSTSPSLETDSGIVIFTSKKLGLAPPPTSLSLKLVIDLLLNVMLSIAIFLFNSFCYLDGL